MDGALLSNGKVKEKWVCVKEETLCDEDHNNHQFPWPAKNYSCNFCRREFKSAQALGGHMNVHRRDRARLRLLPSWVPENSCPNPNFYPSFFKSTSSNSTGPQDHHHVHQSWLCSTKEKDHDEEEEEEVQVVKKNKKIKKSNLVNLELKMGIHHHLEASNGEDGLDLELRL